MNPEHHHQQNLSWAVSTYELCTASTEYFTVFSIKFNLTYFPVLNIQHNITLTTLEKAVCETNTQITEHIFHKSTQILTYADDVDIVARIKAALIDAF
jgi:hypothetical protein